MTEPTTAETLLNVLGAAVLIFVFPLLCWFAGRHRGRMASTRTAFRDGYDRGFQAGLAARSATPPPPWTGRPD